MSFVKLKYTLDGDNNKFINLAVGTASGDAINLGQLEAHSFKYAVRLATTANITLSGLQTIDGVSGSADDRILVKNQSTAADNGIYLMKSGAWVRTQDGDGSSDFVGQIFYVREGSTQSNSMWSLTTSGAIAVGSTSLTYKRIGRANQATAGTYGSGTLIPVITLNDDGTISSIVDTAITGAVSGSGASGRVTFWNGAASITSSSTFTFNSGTNVLGISDLTIDGANSTLYTTAGILQLKGTSAGTFGTILLSESTGNAIVLSSGTSTATSGEINRLTISGAFSPTFGTGVHRWINIAPGINQTGGASGVTAALHIEPTLIAVADFRGLELTFNDANAWGIYQSGANTKNYFSGKSGFGTSSPGSNVLYVVGATQFDLGSDALGDTFYRASGGGFTRLAGNTTTTKQFLSQTGNGSISAAPAWATIAKTDIADGSIFPRLGSSETIVGLWNFTGGALLKDSVTYFYDDADNTKQARFQLSGITTGTTRNFTLPDADGTIALTSDISSGTVLVGGNTLGGILLFGTNDNNDVSLETSGVERLRVTGGSGIGGLFTFTNVNANTNSVVDVATLSANSTGTPTTGYGTGLLFSGKSSTTNDQQMARISAVWTTATHASREAKISLELGDSGGALAEIANFNTVDNSTGSLTLGSSLPVILNRAGLVPSAVFIIGGSQPLQVGSSGDLSVVSSSTAATAFAIKATSNTATPYIDIGGSQAFTITSGTKRYLRVTAGFAPTSGTATFALLSNTATFNQTGGASGIIRFVYDEPTLTAVSNYRSFETSVNTANAYGFYQSGASSKNYFAGKVGFGATPSSTYQVLVSGLAQFVPTSTPTSNTDGVQVAGTFTSATNSLTINGVNNTLAFTNSGTPTGNSYQWYSFTGSVSGSTAGTLIGYNGTLSSSSANTTTIYGGKLSVTTNPATGSGNITVYGLRVDVTKSTTNTDANVMRGVYGKLADFSTSGRINTAIGLEYIVESGKDAYGISVTVDSKKGGSGNTQHGIQIASTATGSGVVVTNSYGVRFIPTVVSSGAITTYYALHSDATPPATTNYFLYANNSSWRCYLGGTLSLGFDSTSARLFIKGTRNTSSSKSVIVQNSSGNSMFEIRDDVKLLLAGASAFNESVNVNGTVRCDAGGFVSKSNGDAQSSSTAAAVRLWNDTAGTGKTWYVESQDNGKFGLSNGDSSTRWFTVLANGKVGINDETPSYDFEVGGEIAGKHIIGNAASAPTNSLGGATIVGTGASCTIVGNDIGLNVSLTTGTGISAAGTILTITFNTAYTTAPTAVPGAKNAVTAAMFKNAELWLETTSTTIVVKSTNNLTSSTTYNFDIVIIGRAAA